MTRFNDHLESMTADNFFDMTVSLCVAVYSFTLLVLVMTS